MLCKQKVFDTVKNDELISLLEEMGIDDKYLRIIKNIYYKETANIIVQSQLIEAFSIELSTILFNVYSERILKQTFKECEEGLLID